jgi:hypothetical protein
MNRRFMWLDQRRSWRAKRRDAVSNVVQMVCLGIIAAIVSFAVLGQCGCARTLEFCEDGSCAGAGGSQDEGAVGVSE